MTQHPQARAIDRSGGAMILSLFGGGWLVAFCLFSHRLNAWLSCLIALVVLVFFGVARNLRKRARELPADPYPTDVRKRNDRHFRILNAVTWVVLFFIFLLLPRVGLSNYVLPSVVALVGLHFLPMPPLYRSPSHSISGVAMVLSAVVCAGVFRSDGYRMAAAVTLCAGLILWASAAWALRTASILIGQARALVESQP